MYVGGMHMGGMHVGGTLHVHVYVGGHMYVGGMHMGGTLSALGGHRDHLRWYVG